VSRFLAILGWLAASAVVLSLVYLAVRVVVVVRPELAP